jgi:caffeoyl-CoA O-methyltransferase
MDLINPQVQQYAEKFSNPEDDLLKEIAAYTYAKHADPEMLSGHLQGKLLEMISCMIRPRRILEIGTFTGYSAICLAKGLTKDGLLHTIDIREEDVKLARSFFDRSPHAKKIISHCGNAKDIIPQLREAWDLVFIDADKPGYIDYFNLVFPAVKKDSFILADNIFFHGTVLDEKDGGKNTRAMQAFNEYIRARADIEKIVLTIRDGLFLVKKL